MVFKLPVGLICLVASVWATNYNFMDCHGHDNIRGFLRRCCRSRQLPNDCECFDISFKSDFTNSKFHKPECPGDLNVQFLLFTSRHPDKDVPIRVGDDSIASSTFQGDRPTKVIIHGFRDSASSDWVHGMRDALLINEDVNVILVDWSRGARGPNYFQAASNTRTVGAMVARLVQELNWLMGASVQSFHMIGHSLGAHVSGIAGKELQRLMGKNLGRISGLDPAGLRFETFSKNVRLDKSDAIFVDVIHTNAEPLIEIGFGIRTSIGHVDFWPNGGKHQPGCRREYIDFSDLTNLDLGHLVACSHNRGLYLYTHSISDCDYTSPEGCKMGYRTDTSCRGDHYPITTDTEPFC